MIDIGRFNIEDLKRDIRLIANGTPIHPSDLNLYKEMGDSGVKAFFAWLTAEAKNYEDQCVPIEHIRAKLGVMEADKPKKAKKITIEELADGQWTKRGSPQDASYEELVIIKTARDILKRGVKKKVALEGNKYKKPIRDIGLKFLNETFIVTDYKQSGTTSHEVRKSTVLSMWDCIIQLKRGKKYTSSVVYELFCKRMGWNEFFVNNVFDKARFRGARDKKTQSKYFTWYYAVKVLQYYQVIDYSSHYITRTTDELKMNRVGDKSLDNWG